MTFSAASQRSVDSYLSALRKELRDLMEEDVNDIVEEIHTHILEKSGAGAGDTQVDQTLQALGSPVALASRYHTEELMKRAAAHRSGAQTALLAIQRGQAVAGSLVAFAISIVGYCLGGGLVLLAVAKILWPRGTGIWESHNPDGTWSLGFSSSSGNTPPNNAPHDVLGWWLVPLGLLLGTALFYATYRFGSWAARFIRHHGALRYARTEQHFES
jgi:hypothetical protein